MSIRLYLEENNPEVERVLLAVSDVPIHNQIDVLENAIAWLKTVNRPYPLTFISPHTRRLAVDENPLLDEDSLGTSARHQEPKRDDPVIHKSS